MEQSLEVRKVLGLLDTPHEETAKVLIQQVVNGNINPLEAHMSIKRMERIMESVKENEEYIAVVKNCVLSNIEGNKKSVGYKGHSIGIQAVHTSYDFTECNDPRYMAWKDIFENAKEQMKLIEEELKAGWPAQYFTTPKRTIVVEELPEIVMAPCGEISTIYPPIKRQKDGLVVRFSKNN